MKGSLYPRECILLLGMLVADPTGTALFQLILHDVFKTVMYDLLGILLHRVRKELLLFVFTSSTHSDRCMLFCISP